MLWIPPKQRAVAGCDTAVCGGVAAYEEGFAGDSCAVANLTSACAGFGRLAVRLDGVRRAVL